ncbi:4Fe-4S binding protein [Thermodesulfobacteriota bacterium]
MNIRSAKMIYFSPTKTTKKIVESIAQGMRVETLETMDLTIPDAGKSESEEIHDQVAIIGVPVYAGRVPLEAVQRLKPVRGNDTPAVVVVVYGNREYEDALLELNDLAIEIGFKPVAGGAFIGEHSFNQVGAPIADGRPDSADLEKAAEFGEMVRKKIEDMPTIDGMQPLQLPGNVPYKERRSLPNISPDTQEDICTKCEECVTACPTAAISAEDTIMTDQDICITCCACVKICPSGARIADNPHMKKMALWLSENCSERKEPEMYV